jgi:acetyltransferase-like isoleucine patch superfamily enzyme
MVSLDELFRRAAQVVISSALFEAPGLFQLKNLVYRAMFDMGRGCIIQKGVLFSVSHQIKGGRLKIGNYVGINNDAQIDYSGGVTIEDHVWISQNVLIETHTHHIKKRMLKSSQPISASPLTIGRDAFIGANAIILPKVECIGEGAVIGAGAIVTKDVPAWAIMVGSGAARQIGQRESEE